MKISQRILAIFLLTAALLMFTACGFGENKVQPYVDSLYEPPAGDEPFDGVYLNGHHENYGKTGDFSIHSSKTVIGKNDEYIFAMIFPRHNDFEDEGLTRSGLYKNDGNNTPVYYLPEVDGCYAQVSRDGQDVWLIQTEWLPWRDNIDMSLPLIRYYKGGELQYTVRLSDIHTKENLLGNGWAQEGMRWYSDFNYNGKTNFAIRYVDDSADERINEYYIDRYTGKVTCDSPRGNNPIIVIFIIAGVVLTVVNVVFICLRRRKRRFFDERK